MKRKEKKNDTFNLNIKIEKSNTESLVTLFKKIKEISQLPSVEVIWQDFLKVDYYLNNEEFLEEFKTKIDWSKLDYSRLHKDLIFKYFEYVNIDQLISDEAVSFEVLNEYLDLFKNNLDEAYLYKNLNEEELKIILSKIPKIENTRFRFLESEIKLSNDFLNQMILLYKKSKKNKADWPKFESSLNLPESFIEKNWNILDKEAIIKNQALSDGFILKKYKEIIEIALNASKLNSHIKWFIENRESYFNNIGVDLFYNIYENYKDKYFSIDENLKLVVENLIFKNPEEIIAFYKFLFKNSHNPDVLLINFSILLNKLIYHNYSENKKNNVYSKLKFKHFLEIDKLTPDKISLIYYIFGNDEEGIRHPDTYYNLILYEYAFSKIVKEFKKFKDYKKLIE